MAKYYGITTDNIRTITVEADSSIEAGRLLREQGYNNLRTVELEQVDQTRDDVEGIEK